MTDSLGAFFHNNIQLPAQIDQKSTDVVDAKTHLSSAKKESLEIKTSMLRVLKGLQESISEAKPAKENLIQNFINKGKLAFEKRSINSKIGKLQKEIRKMSDGPNSVNEANKVLEKLNKLLTNPKVIKLTKIETNDTFVSLNQKIVSMQGHIKDSLSQLDSVDPPKKGKTISLKVQSAENAKNEQIRKTRISELESRTNKATSQINKMISKQNK